MLVFEYQECSCIRFGYINDKFSLKKKEKKRKGEKKK